jgi:hypothetical protein
MVHTRGEAASLHDKVSAALGIPSLHAVTLPASTRELRVSTGAGMILGAAFSIVRIVQDERGTRGELWRYGTELGRVPQCGPIAHRLMLQPTPDWSLVLARLDALGIDELKAPHSETIVFDAGELLVESRRGTSYRSVDINAPRLQKGDAARRATIIAALVDSLDRASPR